MIPLIRNSRFFFPLSRPNLYARPVLCGRTFRSVPTLWDSHKSNEAPPLSNRMVKQIEKDPKFIAELSKMYKAQSEDQDFKEVTYENMVHVLSKFSDVNPVMFLLSKGFPPPIPGLTYQPKFLDEETQHTLRNEALQLHTKVCTHQKGASVHKSKGHNLPFEKQYKLLHFEDVSGRKINAQSFTNYGSSGHDLTYFINNQNIPKFIHEGLVARISQMDTVQALASKIENPLNWRFTFNVYKEEKSQQASFDWHKDISSNGEITSITTILGSATFQIRPEDRTSDSDTYSIPLTPGSIVLLSGDSRWKWEHRVLPQKASVVDSIGRISLVLGCR